MGDDSRNRPQQLVRAIATVIATLANFA